MAKRPTKILDAPTIRSLSKPGRHADGEGLYLIIDASGAKRWAFLFRWEGKLKEMGLGGLSKVSLKLAREKASEARELLGQGANPIEARKALEEVPTFGKLADDLIKVVEKESRNAKHLAGWKMTLTTHAAPIRDKKVNTVTLEDIRALLAPLAESIPETASRLRGRIERVFDIAKSKGHYQSENPARWKGGLKGQIPQRPKLSRGHHKALPFGAVPAFIADLHNREGTAALALEFLVLTVARSNEVIGATWGEIAPGGKTWIVPPHRMKGGREHRVALPARAVEILELAGAGSNKRPDAFIFQGPKKRGSLVERTLSTNALRALLIRMGVDATPHGFRSSFRDWAGEATSFPRELAEAALAHLVGDETERAYRRGDALEKRRKLMDAWSAYVERAPAGAGNVRQFRAAAG